MAQNKISIIWWPTHFFPNRVKGRWEYLTYITIKTSCETLLEGGTLRNAAYNGQIRQRW